MKLNVSELSTEIGAFENATIFKHGLDRVRTQSFLPPSIRPFVNIRPSHHPAGERRERRETHFRIIFEPAKIRFSTNSVP